MPANELQSELSGLESDLQAEARLISDTLGSLIRQRLESIQSLRQSIPVEVGQATGEDALADLGERLQEFQAGVVQLEADLQAEFTRVSDAIASSVQQRLASPPAGPAKYRRPHPAASGNPGASRTPAGVPCRTLGPKEQYSGRSPAIHRGNPRPPARAGRANPTAQARRPSS